MKTITKNIHILSILFFKQNQFKVTGHSHSSPFSCFSHDTIFFKEVNVPRALETPFLLKVMVNCGFVGFKASKI